MCRPLFSLISIVVLSLASTSSGMVIGDFEDGVGDWTPTWEKTSTLAASTLGATTGSQSLSVKLDGTGYWAIQWNAPAVPKLAPGALLQFDLTMIQSEWTQSNWTKVADKIALNSDGAGAWKEFVPQATDKATGQPAASDWGPWNPSVVKTFAVDVSGYDVTGATWFQVIIALQQNPAAGAGFFYIDNVQLVGAEFPVPPLANIILVTEARDADADGVRDDQNLEDWLIAEGYAVDARPGYWMVLDPNKIAELNAADLVIISRTTSSGNYDDSAEEIAAWNAVTAPMLNLTAYLVRNSRWKLVNSGTNVNITPLLMAVDPNHPVFAGIELDQDGIVDILDPSVGTGQTSFLTTLDMGNGTLIAQGIGGNYAWIAEWPAGVEYYAGAGQFAGGKRMMFMAGTQEVGATPQGALNLNEVGLKMFANAIEYLMVREPIAVAVENFSFELPGTVKIKGWNGEGVAGTPAVDIPGWASDSAVADSGVETGFGATDGTWTAFLMGADPSVWQLTDYIIDAEDVFELQVDARNTWQGTTLRMILFYDEGGIRIPAAFVDAAVTDAMQTLSLVLDAKEAPDAVGKQIGIEFDNVTTNGQSWIGLDKVQLTDLEGR